MIWPANWRDSDIGTHPVRPCERTSAWRWAWKQDEPCVTAVQQVGIMEGRYLRQILSEKLQ